jgi:uncharacterized membrane protein YiaA
MTSHKSRALAIFAVTTLVLAIIFFTVPINIFDGQIDYKEGNREYTVDAPLSLAYFIGLGYEDADMQFVQDFRLTTKGWVMAVIFIFGFPALLAYRIYLKAVKS